MWLSQGLRGVARLCLEQARMRGAGQQGGVRSPRLPMLPARQILGARSINQKLPSSRALAACLTIADAALPVRTHSKPVSHNHPFPCRTPLEASGLRPHRHSAYSVWQMLLAARPQSPAHSGNESVHSHWGAACAGLHLPIQRPSHLGSPSPACPACAPPISAGLSSWRPSCAWRSASTSLPGSALACARRSLGSLRSALSQTWGPSPGWTPTRSGIGCTVRCVRACVRARACL